MTARDLGVNAHQHSVRRTARERPQVKYTIDMRSDDNSDSEESRDGDQEQLSRFQTSLGIRMCAADPRYITHEGDGDRGDESKWDPIRKKLVTRLLEEQDKVLRSYFAQKGGARSQGGEVTGGSEVERPENVRAHTYTQRPSTQNTKQTTTRSRLAYPLQCRGY